MADVRELVDRVRSKLTDEQRSEVGSDLETIKSGYLEKVDEAKAAVSESMERKRKIRESKEAIEDLTLDRDSWKTKFESHDDTSIIKERNTYKEKWNGYIDSQKGMFDEFLTKAQESPSWEKVKSEYIIPEEGKELTSDQIENNVSKMQYHSNLGLFEVQEAKPNPPTSKGYGGERIPTVTEYMDIKAKHGVHSHQAVRARELLKMR